MQRLYNKFRKNKLKFFLITLLYAGLLTAVMMLLTFRHSSEEQTDYMKTYIGNRVSMVSGKKNIEVYVIQDMVKLDCVKDYNMISIAQARFRDQEPYIPDWEAYKKYLEERKIRVEERGMKYDEKDMGTAQIIEVNDLLTSHFFLTKGYRVIEGEPLTPNDQNRQVALVSGEFAKLNHLKVGDIVKTENEKNDYFFGATKQMDLKIIGIFEYTENGENFGSPRECPANYIFKPIGEISEKYRTTFTEVNYFLKEGETLETLKEEIREKCFWDPDNFFWSTTGDWFTVVSGPMDTVRMLSDILLVIMAAGMLIIVFLLVAFQIKSDNYEIGLLMSLGERKGKLVLFVLLEEWIPLVIGMFIALLVGVNFSGVVGDMVSSRYINTAKELIEDKNTALDVESPETKAAISEIGRTGRQIQMNLRYDEEYRVNGRTMAILVIVAFFLLPLCMVTQILYKIKFYSVKKILLN